MADFQYQVQPSTATGLMSGLQSGLNAGTLIQENRMKRDAETRQIAATKRANEQQDAAAATAYLKENWVPDEFKVKVYNQKVQPWLQSMGIQSPELTEWDPEHNKLAKEADAFMTGAQKTGMHPQDMQNGLAMLLSKYDEERQKSYKPMLDSLKAQSANETKVKTAGESSDLSAQRLDLQKKKVVDNYVTQFNADKEVLKSDSMASAANTVKTLVTSNNPIAQKMVPTMMVKLSGDIGNIPESAKADLGGDQSIASNMARILNRKATGEPLLPKDIAYMNQISELLGKQAKEQKQLIAQRRAKQYSASGLIDENSLLQRFIPGFVPGAAPAAGAGNVEVGTVDSGYKFKGGDPADQNNWEPE